MASVVDAFNEAINEDMAFVKIAVYAIPVYFIVKFFMLGQMGMCYLTSLLFSVVLLALLTKGINNVRMNKSEILSINPFELTQALLKSLIVLVPNCVAAGFLGVYLANIEIPSELPQAQTVYACIVWIILFSMVLTSYLSFAKSLDIKQGFNYSVVIESCMDVLISFLFYLPQLAIANVILVGPMVYVFFLLKLPYTHIFFVVYCCCIFVINISMLANFFAQTSYEHIKGNNDDYNENINLNTVEVKEMREPVADDEYFGAGMSTPNEQNKGKSA